MVIDLGLLAFNWKMALAAVWPLPVAFAIVALAARVQEGFSRRSMAARIACEDGIQEYVETMADLRANNAQDTYFQGLAGKIRAMEHRAIISEFGTATFVVSAGLVLRLGMATTALAGAWLLTRGELDVLTFGSAGGVGAFVEQYGPVNIPAIAIGPVTARALERAGMPGQTAPEISAQGLAQAVGKWAEEK